VQKLRRLNDDVDEYYKGLVGLDDLVKLGPGIQMDLGMWRDVICRTELLSADMATPLACYVRRDPELYFAGDASKLAGGGLLALFGVCFRVDWPALVVEWFETMERKEGDPPLRLTINHLELAVTVLGLGVLKQVAAARGYSRVGKAVLALSDNRNAVGWMNKAQARDGRAHALMRLHGKEEMLERFSTLTEHVAGVDNTHADLISRLPSDEIPAYLSDVTCPLTGCPTPWTQVACP
jgi:hypothetical protein